LSKKTSNKMNALLVSLYSLLNFYFVSNVTQENNLGLKAKSAQKAGQKWPFFLVLVSSHPRYFKNTEISSTVTQLCGDI